MSIKFVFPLLLMWALSALAEHTKFVCFHGDKAYTFNISSEQQKLCPSGVLSNRIIRHCLPPAPFGKLSSSS